MKPTFTPEQEAEMAAYKRRDNLRHEFHSWINARQDERRASGQPWERSLYRWKDAMGERSRLVIWLRKARTGELPAVHKQCSHSQPEPIANNRLICARGVDVTECPILQSLYAHAVNQHFTALSADDVDEIAADVCAWHIYTGAIGFEDNERAFSQFDTSEGYVQHEGDRMFWDNVYGSLSAVDGGDAL